MQAEEFLRKVKDRAHLEDTEQSKQAVHAVFGALRSRISHGGGDNMASQLPRDVRQLWESSLADHIMRSLHGVQRLRRHEFLEKVQHTAHLSDISEAEIVTRAVIQTLREQITDGAQFAVESQLPGDIKELWQSAAPGAYTSESIGPSAVEVFRSDDQIEHEVEDLLEASDEVDSHAINVAVRQGTVTLSGKVKDDHQREAAACIARDALGTIDVVNEITIRKAAAPRKRTSRAKK